MSEGAGKEGPMMTQRLALAPSTWHQPAPSYRGLPFQPPTFGAKTADHRWYDSGCTWSVMVGKAMIQPQDHELAPGTRELEFLAEWFDFFRNRAH